MKCLLHENVGRAWRDQFEAENAVQLTTLRPRRQSDTFARFLAEHPVHLPSERTELLLSRHEPQPGPLRQVG